MRPHEVEKMIIEKGHRLDEMSLEERCDLIFEAMGFDMIDSDYCDKWNKIYDDQRHKVKG